MNILLVSQYFWPESFIINDLMTCLAEQGHTIEVLTGKPNYPEGAIYEGYRAKGCFTETWRDQIVVHRVPITPRGRGGAKRLLMNYCSFMFSGLRHFYRLVKTSKFDVIVVFAPSPITSAIPAMWLKKRMKIPLAIWVQDLWPESLSATGFVRNPWILRGVGYFVRWIYGASDALLVQSESFREPISRYANAEKIVYYPNSYRDQSSANAESVPEGLIVTLERYRCFVFAGNLGTAQALETLVIAAEQLRHLADCKIVLIGSGSRRDWIAEQVKEKALHNVILVDRLPFSAMPAVFARAAGLIVSLKQDPVFIYTIPSKIQAYLAAGRPIIGALDGEGARIIVEAEAGLVGPAEDADRLAENITALYHMPSAERDALGQAGRAFFLQHFEMVSQSRRLIDILSTKERA